MIRSPPHNSFCPEQVVSVSATILLPRYTHVLPPLFPSTFSNGFLESQKATNKNKPTNYNILYWF